MELWIRSQDRKDLVSTTSLSMTKGDYEQIGIFANGINIGMYKTKERALEVLDEIQRILTPSFDCEPITREITTPSDHYRKYVCEEYIQTIQELPTYVYEMPSE